MAFGVSVFANDRLRLSVTDNCNFSCEYCTNEGQLHNRGNYIDIEIVKKIATKIKEEEIYVRKVNITGGEPLLHKELLKIVECFSAISESVTINTNGSLLDRKKIISLHGAGISNIKFGIDSLVRELTKPCISKSIYDKNKIIDNLLFSVELMPRSSANVVLTTYNANEFDCILEFMISQKINLVEFLELIKHDFRHMSRTISQGLNILTLIEQKRSYFSEITYNRKLAKFICTTNTGLAIQFAEDFCLRRVCQNLWTRIGAKGDFVPCIKAQESLKIDLKKKLRDQILLCNAMMCNASTSHLPRDYLGNLLEEANKGAYISPNYKHPLYGTNTSFDP